MAGNILEAVFKRGYPTVYTKKAHQWDKEVVVRVFGIELPDNYYVNYSNDPEKGIAIGRRVYGYEIPIPNELFQSGEYVYVWISPSEKDSESVSAYQVIIPVERRPVIYIDRGGLEDLDAEVDEANEQLVIHGGDFMG